MGKFIDLTGQRFGKLTVIERIENAPSGQARWRCKCDCGNEKIVTGGNLRAGNVKSCGCLNKIIDLTGQKFGKLTAIKYVGKDKNSSALWECKCDCGNKIIIPSSRLKNGNTKSCGCLKKELLSNKLLIDLTGEKFGKLTVLKRADYNSNGNKPLWICQCECGNIITVLGDSLRRGVTQSCGCQRSKGENKISQILIQNHIQFEIQKTFTTCRFPDTNRLAFFDFYLPEYNILIEYDGDLHFYSKNSGWNNEEKLQKTQEHDVYKNQWCKDNDITLIRIPYTHYESIIIDDLLEQSKYRI